jgi:hypothetical protein
MTIILEQISLCFAYVVEGRLIPSYGLDSSAMLEAMGKGRSVVDRCQGHGESFRRELMKDGKDSKGKKRKFRQATIKMG